MSTRNRMPIAGADPWLYPYRTWLMMHPPVLPKLYWGAISQEQRIAEICRRLCSVTDYLNYLSEVIVDLPEQMKAYTDAAIAEFQSELDDVLAQIQELVESMEDDVAQAKADAAQAAADAANALSTAQGVDAKATQAMNDAANALSTAQGIDGKATQAMGDASTAETNAANALAIAQGIDGKATQAMNDAAAALAAVSQAAADAAAALAAAQAAQTTANQAATNAASAVSALAGFKIADFITNADLGTKFSWGEFVNASAALNQFSAIVLYNETNDDGMMIGNFRISTSRAYLYNEFAGAHIIEMSDWAPRDPGYEQIAPCVSTLAYNPRLINPYAAGGIRAGFVDSVGGNDPYIDITFSVASTVSTDEFPANTAIECSFAFRIKARSQS